MFWCCVLRFDCAVCRTLPETKRCVSFSKASSRRFASSSQTTAPADHRASASLKSRLKPTSRNHFLSPLPSLPQLNCLLLVVCRSAALTRNRQTLGYRYIEVFRSAPSELQARNIPISKAPAGVDTESNCVRMRVWPPSAPFGAMSGKGF